jgi:hypothetical protein
MKTVIISFVLLMTLVGCSLAQDHDVKQDTLLWTVDQLVDKAANSTTDFACQFITYPSGEVRWIQSDYITNFSGSWRQSSWADLSVPGEIESNVSADGTRGYLRFSKDNNGFHVEMFFMEDGQNKMPFQFRVQTVMPYQP